MSKKKGKIKVSFIGTNSTDVAGSCTHIEMENFQILLECGLTQGGTVLEDYRINSAKFPFHLCSWEPDRIHADIFRRISIYKITNSMNNRVCMKKRRDSFLYT